MCCGMALPGAARTNELELSRLPEVKNQPFPLLWALCVAPRHDQSGTTMRRGTARRGPISDPWDVPGSAPDLELVRGPRESTIRRAKGWAGVSPASRSAGGNHHQRVPYFLRHRPGFAQHQQQCRQPDRSVVTRPTTLGPHDDQVYISNRPDHGLGQLGATACDGGVSTARHLKLWCKRSSTAPAGAPGNSMVFVVDGTGSARRKAGTTRYQSAPTHDRLPSGRQPPPSSGTRVP